MTKEFNELLNEFKRINKMHYVESINNHNNGIGLTFENLLGKMPDSMFFPDFKNIEIKCTQRFSRYPIALFSIAFDGPNLYETNNLLQKYGKKDIAYPNNKILISDINCSKKILVNDKYFFNFKIDKRKKKLFLEIYDINFKVIEKEAYIDFTSLENKMNVKLNKLAVVWASKKIIDNRPYYRYYAINMYTYKDFKTFISLLEKDIISAKIICRSSRSGAEEGRQRNKNIVFYIKKDQIDELFNPIIKYNCDEIENSFQIIP